MGQGVNLRTGIIGILTLGAALGEMTVAGTGLGQENDCFGSRRHGKQSLIGLLDSKAAKVLGRRWEKGRG